MLTKNIKRIAKPMYYIILKHYVLTFVCISKIMLLKFELQIQRIEIIADQNKHGGDNFASTSMVSH
jgi:hypothetical protein